MTNACLNNLPADTDSLNSSECLIGSPGFLSVPVHDKVLSMW